MGFFPIDAETLDYMDLTGRDEDIIALTWYDFVEPYMLTAPVGTIPGREIGVYSCFFPARRAQITFNGEVIQGNVYPETRGDRVSSSACLAWSETWVGS